MTRITVTLGAVGYDYPIETAKGNDMSYDNFLGRQLDAEHQREIDEDNRHQRVMYQMANMGEAELNNAFSWLSDSTAIGVMRDGLLVMGHYAYRKTHSDNAVGMLMDKIDDKTLAKIMRNGLNKDGQARQEVYEMLLRGVKL